MTNFQVQDVPKSTVAGALPHIAPYPIGELTALPQRGAYSAPPDP